MFVEIGLAKGSLISGMDIEFIDKVAHKFPIVWKSLYSSIFTNSKWFRLGFNYFSKIIAKRKRVETFVNSISILLFAKK